MAKSSFNQSPYYYGVPDVYMQMGYYPFPTPPISDQTPKQIHVPYPMSIAAHCKYFLGQTEKITAGGEIQGFGALSNPFRSGVILFVHSWQLTNYSEHPAEVQIWFGKTESITGAKTSTAVSASYAQLSACPPPQGKILFATGDNVLPRGGAAVTTRMVPPMSTIEAKLNGQWMLGPGMTMMAVLPAEEKSSIILFSTSWWEQSVY
ncbi:DUF6143 family protein [Brevibacillus centrosporus]|uniref:DUF6143 family protein n=1 Tax=Brevibacillus centrosporus TaxID=54910 RepID=UPI000F0A2D7E|nr:DUF6143 family protein [Brevibacillus centrosporus]MEC2131282.1 DUF6143 family protein [Brevibacillus centrosporus]RNB72682.1 hypothetical protein EDM55_05680 [Brevibacillus centrosporus]GED33652.1 hypothetical protein BCE02nite_47930 [Brevibacillus centrosporus]